MPKGIPDDISELAKYDVDEYGGDGHSHSYLGITEFIDAAKRVKQNWPQWTMREDQMDWELALPLASAHSLASLLPGIVSMPTDPGATAGASTSTLRPLPISNRRAAMGVIEPIIDTTHR